MVTLRSAVGPRVAVVMEVLFVEAGSGVDDELSVAVFSIANVAAGDTANTNVNVAGADGTSEAIVQVTVPAASPQLKTGPLFCVALTKVVPGGRTSASVTFTAVEGPPFVAVMV